MLVSSHGQLARETGDLLAQYHQIVCTAARTPTCRPRGIEVISAEHTDRQSTFIVRSLSEPPPGTRILQGGDVAGVKG